MSIIQTIGTKNVTVAGQSISLAATLEQDDVNGQLFLRVAGTIGQDSYDHRHSLGAEDGNDALAGLTPAQIKAAIQSDLDTVRQKVAQVLATRAAVKALAGQLA